MNFVAVNSLAFETEILGIIRDSLFQIPIISLYLQSNKNNKITTKVEKFSKLLKSKYNTIEYDCVIRKVNKCFFKSSGFKYDKYCQEYIRFSSRRHTKEITSGYEKVLALQKPIPVLIKKREY